MTGSSVASAPALQAMGSLERGARVAMFFVLLGALSLAYEIAARVAGLWLAPEASRARRTRGNALCRSWGRAMARLLERCFDISVEVSGRVPREGRFVIACNHQSSADIVLLIDALSGPNLKFVAKEELGRGLPFVSAATRHFGHVLVGREPSRRDVEQLHRYARELAAWDGSAVVFAEGTRSRDGAVLPYRAGALRILAQHVDLPLLPVAIDGTHVAADLSQYARRMPRARFRVIVGEPIPAATWRADVDEAARQAREFAVAALGQAG